MIERKRPRRRGMFVLPSLFTAGNIAAGYYAITQSLQGSRLEPRHFDYAALAILFAIPFDALDGRIESPLYPQHPISMLGHQCSSR